MHDAIAQAVKVAIQGQVPDPLHFIGDRLKAVSLGQTIESWSEQHLARTQAAVAQAVKEVLQRQEEDPLGFVGDRLRTMARGGPSARWSRPIGMIHKSTFAVRDPEESAAFCVRYLDATRLRVPDPDLEARGIQWVRLPQGEDERYPASEFHFVPWSNDYDTGKRGGVDLNGDGIVSEDEMVDIDQQFIASLVDGADQDMAVWSVYANTHVAWCVAELTSVARRLLEDGVPFFGPTRRADGVYQLYVELPYLHYLEVDSLVYDGEVAGKPAVGWGDLARRRLDGEGAKGNDEAVPSTAGAAADDAPPRSATPVQPVRAPGVMRRSSSVVGASMRRSYAV